MKLYILWPDDQRAYNWLIMRYVHPRGREPRFTPLSRYQKYVCGSCGRISFDDVFASGFPVSATKLRAKGDLLITDDGFWCVRQNVVELFQKEQIDGIHFNRISDTDWYVLNISRRLPIVNDVYKEVGELCPGCGKSTEIIGCVVLREQILETPPRRSVFTTGPSREHSDRDVLVDREIIDLMVRARIKGGTATLIPSAKELEQISNAQERGEKVVTGVFF